MNIYLKSIERSTNISVREVDQPKQRGDADVNLFGLRDELQARGESVRVALPKAQLKRDRAERTQRGREKVVADADHRPIQRASATLTSTAVGAHYSAHEHIDCLL